MEPPRDPSTAKRSGLSRAPLTCGFISRQTQACRMVEAVTAAKAAAAEARAAEARAAEAVKSEQRSREQVCPLLLQSSFSVGGLKNRQLPLGPAACGGVSGWRAAGGAPGSAGVKPGRRCPGGVLTHQLQRINH